MALSGRQNRYIAAGLIVPLLGLFIFMVHSVLVPVALGALFAVMLYPLVPWLHQHLIKRLQGMAVPSVLMLAILLGLAPVTFVVVMSVQTLKGLGGNLTDLRKTVADAVSEQLSRAASRAEGMGIHVDVGALRDQVTDVAQEMVRYVAAGAGGLVAATPQGFVNLFLFLCALYFFLRDGPRWVRWVGELIPFNDKETRELFDSVRQAVHGVVLSSILVGLLQSALCLVAMLIFGIPGAFVWSMVAFLLSFLPMLGTTPVTFGCVVYLALADRFVAAAIMVGAAVFIGTIDNLVRPLAQGSQSKMHPLLTLLAIFGGLEAMGPAGIFLGPVIAAVALWSIDTYARWKSAHAQA